ncbi:MAG: tetratricopeptide repeat protein [Bacteroidia bacterium]
MNNFKIFCLTIFVLLNFKITAQNDKIIDSLKNELLKTNHADTTKINILFQLVENINDDNIWPNYNNQAYSLSIKLLKTSDNNIKLFAQKAIADYFNNKGYLYKIRGNTKKAIQYYLKSLTISNKLNYTYGEASSSINLATLLSQQKQFDEANNYYLKAIELANKLNNKSLEAICLQSIGGVYYNKLNYDSCELYLFKSKQLFEEIKDTNRIAEIYNGLGVLYDKKGEQELAEKYHYQALEFLKSVGNLRQLSNTYYNISKLYTKTNNYKSLYNAINYIDSAFFWAQKINYLEGLLDIYHLKSEIHQKLANFNSSTISEKNENLTQALKYYKLYKQISDSLFNKEVLDNTIKQQLNFEFEKKEAALIAEQEKKEAIAKSEKQRQKLLMFFIASIALAIAVMALLIYRSLTSTKKQKNIIEQQKQLVEQKQKEILDSIQYAKRIQMALLTNEFYIEKQLNRLKINK